MIRGVRALIGEVHVGGGLDGLGVQHAGRRLRASALGFAYQAPQQAGELLEHAVVLPLGDVSVDRGPRGEVVRQVAPRSTTSPRILL